METIYQLNADDLYEDFLEGLKASFKHKEIEIVVYERDDTAYLLRSPANRSRLLEAVADIEQTRNLVTPDPEQFQLGRLPSTNRRLIKTTSGH
jgi:antitoxin YefM